MCATGNRSIDTGLAIVTIAVGGYYAAPYILAGGWSGAAAGAAFGAASSSLMAGATGGNIGRAALTGGILGGVTAGIAGGSEGLLASQTDPGALQQLGSVGGFFEGQQALHAGFGITTAAATTLGAQLTPGTPEYYNAYQQQQQQYNSQPSTVTGSGGKQAAFSLAESVRRAKKRKLTQEDVSELSIDTSSFASEGLQFA